MLQSHFLSSNIVGYVSWILSLFLATSRTVIIFLRGHSTVAKVIISPSSPKVIIVHVTEVVGTRAQSCPVVTRGRLDAFERPLGGTLSPLAVTPVNSGGVHHSFMSWPGFCEAWWGRYGAGGGA